MQFSSIYRRKSIFSVHRHFFNLFLIDIYTPLCYYIIVPREQREKTMCMPPQGGRKENVIMKKFCTKCGKPFESIGREVICPACKAQAAEDAKRAAVLKAKRASWNGESVPVRISGRASTIIRRYGAANNLPFAAALDELLKASDYFKGIGQAWEEVEPYRSHRRDKATSTTEDVQEVKQDGKEQAQDTASKPQEVTKAAKTTSTSKAAKKTIKTVKTAGKKE